MTSYDNEDEKPQSLRRGSLKVIFFIVVLVVLLSLMNTFFGWASYEEIPPYLQPYSIIILLIHPYLPYIQGGVVFLLGYLIVNAVSGLVYTYMRRMADHPTAATVRTIAKISGIAVLLSLMTSVFNVNPAAALTVGSFGGLVIGFATQTILSHVVAGIFLLISRPFAYGDEVTIKGQTGVVKQVRLMRLVLDAKDKEIMIPSGTVVTEIIHKMKPPATSKPAKTILILDPPSTTITEGSSLIFTGKLVEANTRDPVPGKTVRILDKDVGGDDLLASGATESDGSFNVRWTAKKVDKLDSTAEVYAKFEGDSVHRKSKSSEYVVALKSEKKQRKS